MIYLVHVVEKVVATLEIEAHNKDEAVSKAYDGNWLERDLWDRDVDEVDRVERKAT